MLDLSTEYVNIRKYPDAEKALQAAATEAGMTGSIVLPAVKFKQGQRTMLSTAFPIALVRSRLNLRAAGKGGSVQEVRSATNRPTMPDHVESVKKYIKENIGGRYIIPPMTLNVRQSINIYEPDYRSDLGTVYIVMPTTARLEITDGGHRQLAIEKLTAELHEDQLADFERDSIAVMITIESDISQIHQDFADCSKTKPLPPSQLAAYDRRNPANGLVLDLIGKCSLFINKIDSTSKTLSKNSTHLFLTNQVRQMVKELLVGQYGMPDDAFEAKAKQLLGSSEDERYQEELKKYIAYINRVTQVIPVWKEIASLSEGTPRNKVTDKRAEGWVCLTATGLVIIGRIGHELFKDEYENWGSYADKLGTIDWHKSAATWQGNIIQNGKVMTQQGPVKGAVEQVRKVIGLPEKETEHAKAA